MSKVKVCNKLPQVVLAAIRGEDGTAKELRLEGNAESEPVEETDLTEHTHRLVRLGHLKIRPAN